MITYLVNIKVVGGPFKDRRVVVQIVHNYKDCKGQLEMKENAIKIYEKVF